MTILKNSKGFTLMELMTVAAIIAILSLIAIPSYQTFQARARQKEGHSLLNQYYLKAASTRAEFGHFPGNFKATGFHPVGIVNYRVRANNNPNPIDILQDDPACTGTQEDCNCITAVTPCPNYKTWTEAPLGAQGLIGVASVAGNPCGNPDTTDTTLKAQAAAWISARALLADIYQIDEMKRLTMCQDGVK